MAQLLRSPKNGCNGLLHPDSNGNGAAINRLYNNPLTAVVVGLVTILLIARIVFILPERSSRDDFAHYYIASQIYLSGQNPYAKNLVPFYKTYGFVYDGETGTVTSPNPPPFFFLFAPVAMLAPNQAFYAWLSIEFFCLVFILWSTRWLLKEDLSTRGWLFLCAAVVGSQWIYGHFFHSQVGLLLVAVVQAALCLNKLEKYTNACVLIALAGLIKIFPFVLLPWFLFREKEKYRFNARRIIINAAFIFLLVIITGIQNWIDYYNFSFRYLLHGSFGIGYNYSLPSFIVNLVYAAYEFKPPQEIVQVWPRIGAASGLIVLAICYPLSFWRLEDRDTEFCFLISAMLLSGARTLGHYFVFLIFPIAVAIAKTSQTTSKRHFLILVLIFLALNLHDLRAISFLFINRYVFLLFNYIPLYGLIALTVYYIKINLSSPD